MTAAPTGGRPAVITDVALLAGVSRQTVSRVLNGSPRVSAAARRSVLDAVGVLGYTPDASARALGSRPKTAAARTRTPVSVPVSVPGPAPVDRPPRPRAEHVLVTGGSGKLGRAVVAQLLAEGRRVSVVDLVPPGRDDVAWSRVDLTDFGQTVGALTGVDDRWPRPDAVVHLAAHPAPGLVPDAALFAANTTSTYHVFAAARLAGIETVVWASSETVLGLPFDVPPPHLPLDEDCGPAPTSSYSLSKVLGEEMARQFATWSPTASIIGLRLSNVMAPADYAAFAGFDADPAQRRWNAWSYLDARDGATAVSAALDHPGTGAQVFVIANADTVMQRSSAELAAGWFPGVPVRGPLGAHQALMSSARARAVLGWQPRHSWRDEV